jgi:hypothetical protein
MQHPRNRKKGQVMSENLRNEKDPLWENISSEQRLRYALGTKLLVIVAVGGIILGAAFGTLGVLLVYLGATGSSDVTFFGQHISTGSVGVASLFMATITVILVIRRTLKSFDELSKLHK